MVEKSCSTNKMVETLYPLVIYEFAIENGPLIVELPIEDGINHILSNYS